MFVFLLALHSLVRWLLFASLIVSVTVAYRGTRKQRRFDRYANALRHWTATFSHIQLMIGIVLYSQSAWVKSFQREKFHSGSDAIFFGLIHIGSMLPAIVLLTIGSAKAKREPTDALKYKTMLRWFSVALIVILLAIPWPFSPLASRPVFRSF